MALADLLGVVFGPRPRLPRDHITRPSRGARKAAKEHIAAMQSALDTISALPGIAEVKTNKRLPRGFSAAVEQFHAAYDRYFDTVREYLPGGKDAKRPGEPGGCGACYAAPMPVMPIEAVAIYREVRTWRDFPKVAPRLAELGEQQFKDIQSLHKGKDPERMRMSGKSVQRGRVGFAKKMQPCPFLDEGKQRCRIWEQRPVCCRMHLPRVEEAVTRPEHEDWPKAVKAHNLRLPVKQQVTIRQLDKRLALELNPFLYASILQLAQVSEGELIAEVGEAPRKMAQDGRVSGRANRNVRHAKKFQKGKKRGRKK